MYFKGSQIEVSQCISVPEGCFNAAFHLGLHRLRDKEI